MNPSITSSARTSHPNWLRRLAVGFALVSMTSCAALGGQKPEIQTRSIDSIPELEALPHDARPVIKISVRQDGEYQLPEEWGWLAMFANRDSSVASGENLESKITRALQQTNRFLVRANNFDDYRDERELEDEGIINEETATKPGKVVGAQYAIRCNVEDLNFAEEESGRGISGFLPDWVPFVDRLNISSSDKVATVRISAEVVSLETGIIVQTVEGRGLQTSSSSKSLFQVKGLVLSQQEKKNPTLANAITECIKELVYEIGRSVPPNEISVVAAR